MEYKPKVALITTMFHRTQKRNFLCHIFKYDNEGSLFMTLETEGLEFTSSKVPLPKEVANSVAGFILNNPQLNNCRYARPTAAVKELR